MYKYLALTVVFGGMALVGCNHDTTVATGPNGEKVTADQNGKSVTFDDGKGHKMTSSAGQVSEADLGVPYYPGSSDIENGGVKMDSPEGTSVSSTRTTGDDVAKVLDFYKSELEKAGFKVGGSMSSGDFGSVSGQKSENDVVSVGVTVDKDKKQTSITITHVVKNASASPSAPTQ